MNDFQILLGKLGSREENHDQVEVNLQNRRANEVKERTMQGVSEQSKEIKSASLNTNSALRWQARTLVLAVSAACIVGAWFYIHRNDPLRVRSLEIIDSKGQVCAILGTASEGQSGLILKDKQGLVRSEFSVDEAGFPCLMLFDKKGSIRAQMSVTQNDRSTLRLADPHGLTRMEMEVNRQGASFLKLHDSRNFKSNVFACDENGNLEKITPSQNFDFPSASSQFLNRKLGNNQTVPVIPVSAVSGVLKRKGETTSSSAKREMTQSSE